MLLKLKEEAVIAEEAYSQIEDRVFEWEDIIQCSDNLVKFLDLDIGEESKTFISKLFEVNIALNLAYSKAEKIRNSSALEYALTKLGGNIGDTIEYVDIKGKNCAIIVEEARMLGENISINGTRFLQSGKVGKLKYYVCLESNQWRLK